MSTKISRPIGLLFAVLVIVGYLTRTNVQSRSGKSKTSGSLAAQNS